MFSLHIINDLTGRLLRSSLKSRANYRGDGNTGIKGPRRCYGAVNNEYGYGDRWIRRGGDDTGTKVLSLINYEYGYGDEASSDDGNTSWKNDG